jgi:hypothetical protein
VPQLAFRKVAVVDAVQKVAAEGDQRVVLRKNECAESGCRKPITYASASRKKLGWARNLRKI